MKRSTKLARAKPVAAATSSAVTTEELPSERRISAAPGSAHRLRRILTISVSVALLLFIVDSALGVSGYILSHIFPPMLQAPASNLFYFQTLPFGGSITLDGHLLAHVPSQNTENPLELSQGTHLIQWQAAPFPSLTCRLVVPPTNSAQNCPTHPVSYPNTFTPSALIVTPLQAFSLRMLSPNQQQALIIAVQHRLDTLQDTDTVQTGETYQVTTKNQTSIQRASQPIHTTLRFLLDTDTSRSANCQGITLSNNDDASCFIAQNDCRLFCTIQWPTAPTDWNVAAVIRSLYTYTELAAPHQVKTSETHYFVTLRISWELGKWAVTFHQPGDSYFDDPGCHDMISTLVTDTRYQSVLPNHWTYTSGAHRAQGCVAVLQANNSTQKTSSPTEIILLARFGVLLTASKAAAQKWPQLPKASTYAQSLVGEILHHPAFVS